MGNWDIEKFLLTVKSIKEYFFLKINIPIFPGPCTRHEYQALLNSNIFTKFRNPDTLNYHKDIKSRMACGEHTILKG